MFLKMNDILSVLEDLKIEEPLFQNVKFYVSGNAHEKIISLLRDGGGERTNYFSDYVTHCILGDDASEADISDAKDLYEVPAVNQKWVVYSVRCKKLLPTKAFLPDCDQLFTGIVACLSQVSSVDCKALWAMITFNGGQCQLNLNKKCTHLITTRPEGAKYEAAMRHENFLLIVTPDWVVDSVRSRGRCEEGLYHPRLLILPKPRSPTPPPAPPPPPAMSRTLGSLASGTDNSSLSTSQILGFADDIVDEDVHSGSKASLLEQLKQRMPWNQPAQKQVLTPLQQQQALQQQQRTAGGQLLQSPGGNVVMTGQGGVQRTMQVVQPHQQVLHQQRVIQQQQIQGAPWRHAMTPQQVHIQKQQFVIRESQSQIQQQPGQPPQTQQYTVTVQRELVTGTPAAAGQLTWQQQQQLHLQQQQRQQLQQQQQQQPGQRQIAWTQQTPAQGPLRQLIHLDPQTHAQLQQMDPQQRALCLQKIQKQRQIILQRQIQAQRQQGIPRQQMVQQPQSQQQPSQVVIRGQLPPGLTPQQQLQLLQQHQQRQLQGQTVVINQQQQQQLFQQNPQLRQQQVLVQQQSPLRQQQLITGGQQPVPQGSAAGIVQSPQQLQTTAATGTWVPQQADTTAAVQQTQANQQQLAQLQLQRQQQMQRIHQLQLQREAAVAAAAQKQQVVVAGPRIQVQQGQPTTLQQAAYGTQVAVQQQQGSVQSPLQQAAAPQTGEDVTQQEQFQAGVSPQGQQPLVVNPKTKTALANMLSIRLQSGTPHLSPQQPGAQGPVLVGQPAATQEGSAAGQLRLMTAQHHAQQHQPPPGILQSPTRPVTPAHIPPDQLLSYQQRRTLGNITNAAGATSPVRPPGMVVAPVLQQQSPPVGTPGLTKSPYSQTAATAVRVAAALAKSAQSVGQVQQQPRPQFYGHNPNLKSELPPDLFLLGCIFFIVDYDVSMPEEVPVWHKVIAQYGGEVETVYGPRVTHLLCEHQKSQTFLRAIRDGKRCVTAYWLNDTVLKQQVLPPWLALHFPTNFSNDDRPCKGQVIAFTGFEGDDRSRIKFMIETVGAKYTTYFTKHNHVLVCRRLEGRKYKKAREWNRPIVNVQWLNDILFGHFTTVQQTDLPKFQQYNLGNPFRIEYAHIPHLMAAWKNAINVSQESYERVKANPPPLRRTKRPRLEKSGDSDQENLLESLEVTSLEPLPEERRPRVIFSHVTRQSELARKVNQLGGSVVETCKEATHLVMSQPVRTIKLLCCLSVCKYILSEAWIRESHVHNRFLDEKPYILSDPELEKEFGCNIAQVLEQPHRNELFKDKTFYMTPGVVPRPSVLAEVVECAGGKVDKTRRPLKYIQEVNRSTYNYIVITVANDLHILKDLISVGVDLFNAEFIMTSVMKQKLDCERRSVCAAI